jgi:uncharacterized protein (DUF1697 family)
MTELKRAVEELGIGNVSTYLQSGNVIFDCRRAEAAQRARTLKIS